MRGPEVFQADATTCQQILAFGNCRWKQNVERRTFVEFYLATVYKLLETWPQVFV